MSKSIVNKDNHINEFIDKCRAGNENNIKYIYKSYHYILKGYIKQNNLNDQEKTKVENYFLNSIKEFIEFQIGYNLVAFLYDKLNNYNEPIVIERPKQIIFDQKQIQKRETPNQIVNKLYNKYYYIIFDYVSEYDEELQKEAIFFAQKLLRKSIRNLVENNDKIDENILREYFKDFDLKFKKDLGNVELILNDIVDGKEEYKQILIDKYLPYIESFILRIKGTENIKNIFLSFLDRTINEYNKDIKKTNLTMNSYMVKNIENIKDNVINKKNDIISIARLISIGKYEYMYLIYDKFSNQIKCAIENSKYDKEEISNFLKRHIYNIMVIFVKNKDYSNINKLQNDIILDISKIDKIYSELKNEDSKLSPTNVIYKARKGNYNAIEELVNYYNYKLKLQFEYSNIENEIIDDLLNKILAVDIKRYLFNEKHKYNYFLSKYIDYRIPYYKEFFDGYLNNIKSKDVDIETSIKLSKESKMYLYYVYNFYMNRVDNIFDELLPSKKHNLLYKSIASKYLLESIKTYIQIADNPNIRGLNNHIYKDFDWFKDIEEEQKKK